MAAVLSPQTTNAEADPLLVVVNLEASGNLDGGLQADNGDDGRRSPYLTTLGFLVLTFNSAMAIVRSQGEIMDIAFIIFSYAVLVALFVCLRMYESAIAGSSKRQCLKILVWILTTLLTFAFSYKVAAVLPTPVAVVVWLMAFATVAGGFVAFFVYKEKGSGY